MRLLKDLPPEPVRVTYDVFLFERALVNLIDNAIDASTRGQTVVIAAIPGLESVMIGVKDQGSGMDKETLDSVFLPFYTKKMNGTGVGMAIIKKIIEEHGGTIRMESRPGRGTRIKVYLPYQ